MVTPQTTLISRQLDSVSKYHMLEPALPHSSAGRAFGERSRGRIGSIPAVVRVSQCVYIKVAPQTRHFIAL